MEMILFTGIQAAGKSSFYLQRFYRTHIRINLDMLKTRRRETLLVKACLEGKISCVIDKMNLTAQDRAAYIGPAKAAGFEVIGYFFESELAACIERNSRRDPAERVPDAAIRHAELSLATAFIQRRLRTPLRGAYERTGCIYHYTTPSPVAATSAFHFFPLTPCSSWSICRYEHSPGLNRY